MTACPKPVQQTDEFVCTRCHLRWDVREDKPSCGQPQQMPARTDRETLELVAKGFRDIMALQQEQKKTMAIMIRACLVKVRSFWTADRNEGLDGLTKLAEMLEEGK